MSSTRILLLALFACAPASKDKREKPLETEFTPPVLSAVVAVPTVLDAELFEAGYGIHQKGIRLAASGTAEVQLACTLSSDEAEVHTFSGAAAREWTLVVRGLLADSRYDCLARAFVGEAQATSIAFDFRTAARPNGAVTLSVDAVPGYESSAYTLLNTWVDADPFPNRRVVVVDPEGRVRWSWFLDNPSGGGIDFSLMADGEHFLVGGGTEYEPTVVDMAGEIVFKSPDPTIGFTYHHHAAELPDGGLLTLSKTVEGDHSGFAIVVISPVTGEVTWSWNSQTAVDRLQMIPDGSPDPYHSNSVSFVDDSEGSGAWVSLRHPSQVIRIDRDSGDVTHILGRGGDFRLLDANGGLLPDDAWFSGQHDPEFDFPKVLVHDNGVLRVPEQSSVMELELDLDALTATVLWTWDEPGWFEPVFGDADRLPNGSVLVTRGACWDGCVAYNLDDERPSNYVEVEPISGEVVWRLDHQSYFGTYRAERVDGCDLFANTRYCPNP